MLAEVNAELHNWIEYGTKVIKTPPGEELIFSNPYDITFHFGHVKVYRGYTITLTGLFHTPYNTGPVNYC